MKSVDGGSVVTCQAAGIPPERCGDGFEPTGDRSCRAILPAADCAPGTFATPGNTTCQPAGIPAEACGKGFLADGEGGCQPVLPAAPCGDGMMALPGESACTAVAPCAEGTWGDIPDEPGAMYVDASYAGGDGDGSMLRPFTSVQAAVDAAQSGALVALAAGSYVETVLITDKVVRLRGRCPSMVELRRGSQEDDSIILVSGAGATGTTIEGVALTGPGGGLFAVGGASVSGASLWLHDLEYLGIAAAEASSIDIRRALVERATISGTYLEGAADLRLEETVVRDTQANPDGGNAGWGTYAVGAGTLTVERCLHEGNRSFGVYFDGEQLTVEGSVIRDTRVQESDQDNGFGLFVEGAITVRRTVVSGNLYAGIAVYGDSQAELEAVTIADTAGASGGYGLWAVANEEAAARPQITATRLAVLRSLGAGVNSSGARLTLESTLVRTVAADAGIGVGVGLNSRGALGSELVARQLQVDGTHGLGISLTGGTATLEGLHVRNTAGSPRSDGRNPGFALYASANGDVGSTVMLSSALIEGTEGPDGAALRFADSRAWLEQVVVRGSAGVGLEAYTANVATTAQVMAAGLIVEGSTGTGVNLGSTDGSVLERLVVRSTRIDPRPDATTFGTGLFLYRTADMEKAGASPPDTEIRDSVIESNVAFGILLFSATATMEGALVRDTGLGPAGVADAIALGSFAGGISQVLLRGLRLERNSTGIRVFDSIAEIDSTAIVDGRPDSYHTALGVNAFTTDGSSQRSQVAITDSLIQGAVRVGLLAQRASVTLRGTTVAGTTTVDGFYGDGLSVQDGGDLDVSRSQIVDSVRAGVGAFGATATIREVRLSCNAIQLDGETLSRPGRPELEAVIDDGGGNECGCGETPEICRVLSAELDPPEPPPVIMPMAPPEPR